MAAFSYQQHHPFLLDQSLFFTNPPNNYKFSGDEQYTTTATTASVAVPSASCFPQFYQPHHGDHQPFHGHHHFLSVESNCPDQYSTKVTAHSYNNDSSSMSVVLDDQKVESGNEQLAKERKEKNGSSLNSAQSKDTTKVINNNRLKKQKKGKDHQEEKKKKTKKGLSEEEEEAPVGYIHVRARRGQATDSHSLAERVRREKISERMKLLQAIVPGCDKVTGKALMLDEIINYVQSLQNQVEFLSMKLASVNPMFYDFGVDLDSFMLKPDQNMSSMGLPIMPSVQVQQCSGTGGNNTFTTTNDNYQQQLLMIDASPSSLLFQQGQIPNILSQGNGQLLWDVDQQKQKLVNPSALGNNLASFH